MGFCHGTNSGRRDRNNMKFLPVRSERCNNNVNCHWQKSMFHLLEDSWARLAWPEPEDYPSSLIILIQGISLNFANNLIIILDSDGGANSPVRSSMSKLLIKGKRVRPATACLLLRMARKDWRISSSSFSSADINISGSVNGTRRI